MKNRVTFIAILLAGFLIRFYGLGDKPFHEDEGWTLNHVLRFSWRELFSHQNYELMTPPLFYLLEKLSATFLGISEFSLRIPSVLFGSLSIFWVYQAGRLMKSETAGLAAAALAAFSPLSILYSQMARSFGLLGFWAILCFVFFIRYYESRKPLFFLAFLSAAMLGLFTHFLFLNLLLANALFFILFAKKWRRWEKIGWCVAALVLSLLFFQHYITAFAQWRHETLPTHIPSGLWVRILEAFFGLALGESVYPFNGAVVLPAILLFGTLFSWGLCHCLRDSKRWGWLLLFNLFFPLACFLYLGDDGIRHLSYAFSFFLLIVGWGVDAFTLRPLRKAALIVLLLIPQTVSAYYWHVGDPDQVLNANLLIPWKEIFYDLRHLRKPDEKILLHPDTHHHFSEYYMPEAVSDFILLPETGYEKLLGDFLAKKPYRLWLLTPPNTTRDKKIRMDPFSCYDPLTHRGYLLNPVLAEQFKTGKKRLLYAAELSYFQRRENCVESGK